MPSIHYSVGLRCHAHGSPCQSSHSTASVLIYLRVVLCAVQMEMETPSIKELQHMYSELDPGRPTGGLGPLHATFLDIMAGSARDWHAT